MPRSKTKLGENGRVVIPASYREALGIKTGDDLILELKDGEVRLYTRRQALRRAQALVHRYVPEGTLLSEELIKDRREEAARD